LQVSVVIPVYNRCETIGRAIRSVVSQTHSPAEVIVVDDGSTDGTPARVRREFGDVVLVRNAENRGVSHARNRGIESASSEWVALLDSDDEWLPAKLEKQLAVLAAQPSMPLCHTDEIWIRNGVRVNPRKRHRKRGGFIFEYCLPLCVISPSAAVIRKDLLDDLGGFDESMPACEDYDLWLRVCAKWAVAFVESPLVIKHGGHADQLSRRHWGMDRFRVAALRKLLDNPCVTLTQREAVLRTMVEKLNILLSGAEKRCNRDASKTWSADLRECRRALATLVEAR
jgi:glycosyltransferase involved in cell wall biosynthesis